MSRASEAPNDRLAAESYVNWLAGTGCFQAIYVAGSRSPLRDKQPHEHSDWDLVAVTDIENLKMQSPRTGKRLHADLLILNEEQAKHQTKIVEVWPNDTHGIFNASDN